jgi:hypothetical protein
LPLLYFQTSTAQRKREREGGRGGEREYEQESSLVLTVTQKQIMSFIQQHGNGVSFDTRPTPSLAVTIALPE